MGSGYRSYSRRVFIRDYQLVITADRSPTLQDRTTGEPMHNLQGAFSESLYIYLETLKTCLQFNSPPTIFSLGLGLAYNEIISIAYLGKLEVKHFNIASYEKDQILKESLLQWLGLSPQKEKHSWLTAYNIITKHTAQHFQLPFNKLKQDIKHTVHSGKWIFQEALAPDTQFSSQANCIFYDAFSEKTDPMLWNSTNLYHWLHNIAQPRCALGSYAAKGVLNRVLKELGFSLIKRTGFAGKKQSTLAIR